MIWEIVNPSDACTIEAPTLEPAALACILIGTSGQYALDPEDGNKENSFPMMMFVQDADKYWITHFGHNMLEGFKAHGDDVITALQSIIYGSIADRHTFFRLLGTVEPDKQTEFRRRWNDNRRTSMNDIGGRAMLMAEKLAERAAQAAGKEAASDGE